MGNNEIMHFVQQKWTDYPGGTKCHMPHITKPTAFSAIP